MLQRSPVTQTVTPRRGQDEPVADGHVDWSFDEETEPDGLQRLDEQSGRTEPGGL